MSNALIVRDPRLAKERKDFSLIQNHTAWYQAVIRAHETKLKTNSH